jgi:hypothetical protein
MVAAMVNPVSVASISRQSDGILLLVFTCMLDPSSSGVKRI